MTRYVLDASAWLEYLDGSAKGRVVRGLLEDEGNDILSSAVSVAEVVSKVQRKGFDGRRAGEAIEAASTVVPMDFTLAVSVGLIHAEGRKGVPDLPYGDAAVVSLAKAIRAKIVTCDSYSRRSRVRSSCADSPLAIVRVAISAGRNQQILCCLTGMSDKQ